MIPPWESPPLNDVQMVILDGSSQSLDLNPTKMLWYDFKQAVHAWKPPKVAELKKFCKAEWGKILPEKFKWLSRSYNIT